MPDATLDSDLSPARARLGAPGQRTRPAARRAAPARWSRGQVTAGVLLLVLGFAAVVQVRSNSDDAELRRRPAGRPDRADQLARARRRSARRTRSPSSSRPATPCSTTPRPRRTALERARQRADELGILAGTLPAIGPGRPGHRRRPRRRGRHRPAAQRHPGAARRRRRGHRDQRPVRVVAQTVAARRAGRRGDRRRRGRSRRRTSSRPSARRTPWPPRSTRRRLHRRGRARRRRRGRSSSSDERRDRRRSASRPSRAVRQPGADRVACRATPSAVIRPEGAIAVYPEDLKYTSEHEWVRSPGRRRGLGPGRHHRLRPGRAGRHRLRLAARGRRRRSRRDDGRGAGVDQVRQRRLRPVSGTVTARNEALDAHPGAGQHRPVRRRLAVRGGPGRRVGRGRPAWTPRPTSSSSDRSRSPTPSAPRDPC